MAVPFNVGDIIQTVTAVTGKDVNGNSYSIPASSFWTTEYDMKLLAVNGNVITVDDGTSNSPVTFNYVDGAFDSANALNALFFTPYVKTLDVAQNVGSATVAVANAATNTVSNAASAVSSLSSYLDWFLFGAVALGFYYVYKKFIS